MHLKMSSTRWRPFCIQLGVLIKGVLGDKTWLDICYSRYDLNILSHIYAWHVRYKSNKISPTHVQAVDPIRQMWMGIMTTVEIQLIYIMIYIEPYIVSHHAHGMRDFHIYIYIYIYPRWYISLKTEGCHYANFIITGGTACCRHGNLRCNQ